MPEFRYDVAFSLLDADEPVAREIARLLPPTLSVFLYSERELETGGTDGIDAFSAVFRRDARIVTILYRERWAQTKWTRLEEQAIKSRFLDDGPNFLLLIHLEPDTPVPPWFPSQYIWLDLARLGSQGAAAVIEERVRVAGGVVRVESPAENAERLQREQRAEAERVMFLRSDRGVVAADQSVVALFDGLEKIARSASMQVDREDGRVLSIYRDGFAVAIGWSVQWRNTLENSTLHVVEWRGRPNVAGRRYSSDGRKEIATHGFDFDVMGSTSEPVWRERGGRRRSFSTTGLADHCATLLLERIRSAIGRE